MPGPDFPFDPPGRVAKVAVVTGIPNGLLLGPLLLGLATR